MCRPLVADPEFVDKSLAGKAGDIRRCLYCGNCNTWHKRPYVKELGAPCTVNPATFREKDFGLKPAGQIKRILVAGGGLAGMEAARTLAMRGHQVSLHEASSRLGGQWLVAAEGEHKEDFRTLVPWLSRSLREGGVEVKLESPVTRALIELQKPDFVVLATGALAREYNGEKPQGKGPVLLQGMDVIMDTAMAGQRVVVVGARYIGMEVAAKLAAQGKHVSIVDARGIGDGMITSHAELYRDQLVERDVFMFPFSPVMRVTSTGIDIANNASMLSLAADTIVFCIGTVPYNPLQQTLESMSVPHASIGDCAGIGDALRAIRDGAELGRRL